MLDDKYIVFKRSEVNEVPPAVWDDLRNHIEPVADAVVIRCQDVFAPPALDAYGNAILCVIEALKDKIAADDAVYERMSALQDIADYFHRRASEAWQIERKLPD